MDTQEIIIYCREHGHDWNIHSGAFWDIATCLTCGAKIRDITLTYEQLP